MYKYVAVSLVGFIAGIAATFTAIAYSDQHPDSFLAPYVNKVRSTIVVRANDCCQDVACAMPTDPTPCPDTFQALPPIIKVEAQPVASAPNRLSGTIVIQEDEGIQQTGAISASEPEPCEVPAQARTIMLSLLRPVNASIISAEEREPVAPFMPYCEGEESAPAVMPPAEESRGEKAAGSIFAFWMSFFSETGIAAPPQGQTPECKEDPTAHLQYPGLPFSGFSQSKKPVTTGKTKTPVAPFEEELQEAFPAPKATPEFKSLLKKDGTLGDPKLHSHIDTTECRPSDFGFDHLGLRPF
jgi:hypothetical protein